MNCSVVVRKGLMIPRTETIKRRAVSKAIGENRPTIFKFWQLESIITVCTFQSVIGCFSFGLFNRFIRLYISLIWRRCSRFGFGVNKPMKWNLYIEFLHDKIFMDISHARCYLSMNGSEKGFSGGHFCQCSHGQNGISSCSGLPSRLFASGSWFELEAGGTIEYFHMFNSHIF
jgi:hypothetical protein